MLHNIVVCVETACSPFQLPLKAIQVTCSLPLNTVTCTLLQDIAISCYKLLYSKQIMYTAEYTLIYAIATYKTIHLHGMCHDTT